ncbi:ATP-binding protein [Tenggerimyces flavus]|uniref:ATP-binding protein n=1 Tax=Tenggerimyces flavus TaxID=1708749 RepID=A0ABV7YLI3_9ACTN|nr:BTAD domain-containing putative transcriptional regulator [Tenggerimyces flavus]MBM7784937.1 putative ATPase/DNA-binding SARP family transcriptional activator/thioredoxin-like negative regulator of GroEL [Tenggerimyces flavus]
MPAGGGAAEITVHVLGPVEVRIEGTSVRLDRPLERALAARLALAAGASVPDDRLARDLWGDTDLNRPTARLQVLASRLRGSLGSVGPAALTRSGGGYALAATTPDLAAAEAASERLQAAVRSGDHAAVRSAASEAVAHWRGPALADLRAIPYALGEGERLDAWLLELRIEGLAADLELGGGTGPEAVAELQGLATEHPLHERLRGLLAVSYYRSGRQADALETLSTLRTALADELGVDPSPATAELELRLLRQEPSLLAAPPPPVAHTPDQRLPVPATSFVGRDDDVADLLERVVNDELVTLLGPPGAGKSRLAIEVARRVERPVTLIELAPLTATDDLSGTFLRAAGLDRGPGDPLQRTAAALSGRLVVVDNAEHVVEATATAVEALRRYGTQLAVIVTSQRPLLISEERVYEVPTLSTEAAAKLFDDRRLAGSGPLDPQLVDDVVAAVDRLPLGVELAAGLTRTLSVSQLAQRIHDRMRLLVGGSRIDGYRHTSLRAALDWSHDLLDPVEQIVLRRAAIFAGGFTLEAAEAVLPDDLLDAGGVAPALIGLADRSLVAVRSAGDGKRFVLLETVRDYAADRLREAGEQSDVLARALRWAREYIEAKDYLMTHSAEALEEVMYEWTNVIALLEAAVPSAHGGLALELATWTDEILISRGRYQDCIRFYEAFVDAPDAEDAIRAEALSNLSYAYVMVGEVERAAGVLVRAGEISARIGNDVQLMRVLYHRGIVAIQRGLPMEALSPLRSGRALAGQLGKMMAHSAFQDAEAIALEYAGDLPGALALYEASLEADRAANNEHGLARVAGMATALIATGQIASAIECLDLAETHADRLGDPVALSDIHVGRGRVLLASGSLPAAIECFRSALSHPDVAESDLPGRMAQLDLADALLLAGAVDEARSLVSSVVASSPEHNLNWLVAQPLLALLALSAGDAPAAASLVASAAAEYDSRSFHWWPAVTRLDRARAGL